jgi:hypothetical protein
METVAIFCCYSVCEETREALHEKEPLHRTPAKRYIDSVLIVIAEWMDSLMTRLLFLEHMHLRNRFASNLPFS